MSEIPDIANIIREIASVVKAIAGQQKGNLIGVLAMLIGMAFFVQAMLRAYALSDNVHKRGEGGFASIVSPVFWGTILISFWSSQQAISEQLNLSSGGLLTPALPSPYLNEVWGALRVILNGFGAIMMFRGFLLAKEAGDGIHTSRSSPGWAAFWHILGGALLLKL